MKLIIVSICLNESKTIKELLERMPKKLDGIDVIERVILDDGSTDDTAKVARENGATVIQNGSQKRLAYSFQKAVDYALGAGADFVVNIDGDLQFSPEEIPFIAEPVIKGDADFVAADRFTDKDTGERRKPENMPTAKYYSNRVGAWIVGKLSGYSFRDVTCGFRAYNREALLAINLNSKYTYTQESFQVLAMRKMNIKSMPVTIKYYPGRKSRVVTNFFKFFMTSTINILRAFRDNAPLSFFFMLGAIPMVVGLILGFGLFIYWINAGQFSPYKFVGFGSLYFTTLGIVIWLIGIMADMLDRVLNNQEKMITLMKEMKYSKDK
jgi:glycosyltransferase involved in cell wall biosynthesis